jgi:hypothetical protein
LVVAAGRDDRLNVLLGQQSPHFIAVVTMIRNQTLGSRELLLISVVSHDQRMVKLRALLPVTRALMRGSKFIGR